MTGFIESLPAIATILFLFLSAVLQQVFPPYPGDSVNIFAGYLSGMDSLHPVLAFVCYFAGTVISSIFLYYLGRKYGPRVMNTKMFAKLTEQKKQRMVLLFKRYGVLYLMACKFLPGLNSIALLLSGAFMMEKKYAFTGIAAVAAMHNLFFFYAGRSVGQNWKAVEKFLYSVNKYAIIIVIIAVAIIGTYFLIRNKISKRKAGLGQKAE